jgi:hypothetical protein
MTEIGRRRYPNSAGTPRPHQGDTLGCHVVPRWGKWHGDEGEAKIGGRAPLSPSPLNLKKIKKNGQTGLPRDYASVAEWRVAR